MIPSIPLTRDLVLVGGGHAHALVLRQWGMAPLPGVRLTVINPNPTAPYTGMLPGHLAGHYPRDALEIDLVRLARFAGARLIIGAADGIDAEAREVRVAGHGSIGYDVASINVGITSDMPKLPGFATHGVAAKPLGIYAAKWRDFLDDCKSGKTEPDIAVIGGGVAGCELAMAMSHALAGRARVTVLERSGTVTGVSASALRTLKAAMAGMGIRLVTNAEVAEVTASAVLLADSTSIPAKLVVGSAGARPIDWLGNTGLPLIDGFLPVDDRLRVKGYQDLFAVGDCAHLVDHPRPKAGVFSVRAAPFLHDNLRATLSGGALKRFRPQRHYLKLISLGGTTALAERGGFAFSGPRLWRLKDWIDRKFMERLSDLPKMNQPPIPAKVAKGVRAEMRGAKPLCGGCGAKVGGGALRNALSDLRPSLRDDVLSRPGDDAAVLRWGSAEGRQVFTTDHLRAFTHDPALLAEVAAIHALGDIWAMGAAPQAALASVTLPRMSASLQTRTLKEVTDAAAKVFRAAGAELAGGHTTQGDDLIIGFSITGLCDRPPIETSGAIAGDVLVLTRPLGSGILLAGEMAMKARGEDVAAMLEVMRKPQGDAARLLAGAHAMTDVTGFGLAGHLMAICRASNTGAEISLEALPAYAGALELAAAGVMSVLHETNRADAPVTDAAGPRSALLHDPQTAGGLLAAVPPGEAERILKSLNSAGFPAVRIGQMVDGAPGITCL